MEHGRLSPFEGRWLAEVVRRHEAAHGPLEDAVAVAAAQRMPADFELRIVERAQQLPASREWITALLRWRSWRRSSVMLALLLAFVTGCGAALGVLGDAGRAVNVVWALGVLLGLNSLMLLLWLLSLLPARRLGRSAGAAPGWLAPLWLRLMRWLDRSPQSTALAAALPGLFAHNSALRWAMGAASHLLWAVSLAGAVLAMLVLLALHSYAFAWETTILPATAFIWLTETLARGPAAFGLLMPDAATIAASGVAPMLAEAGRRAWAAWLVGVVLVYGVLPRLLLAGLCLWLTRRQLGSLKLDLQQPGYARLRARLLPASSKLGVVDPAPAAQAASAAGTRPVTTGEALLLALEIDPASPWPPPSPVLAELDGGRIDSREQRQAVLSRLRASPSQRLLLAVEQTRVPDRGLLALIAELSGHAGKLRICLLKARTGSDEIVLARRRAQWLQALDGLGLEAADLYAGLEAAACWLVTGEEGGR